MSNHTQVSIKMHDLLDLAIIANNQDLRIASWLDCLYDRRMEQLHVDHGYPYSAIVQNATTYMVVHPYNQRAILYGLHRILAVMSPDSQAEFIERVNVVIRACSRKLAPTD